MALMSEASERFTWASAMLSHPGNVRSVNEDSFAEYPQRGIWLVADGMGGHRAGDVASQRIVEVMGSLSKADSAAALIEQVEDRLQGVNTELIDAAARAGDGATMGSTVLVMIAYARWVFCLWAGDSRLYRLRNGVLEQVTRDHSQVEEMVVAGQISAEQAQEHPLANVITRAVGGGEELYLDVDLRELRDGDRYLLCSDGLFKDLRNEDIARLVVGGGCAEACERLIAATLEGEAGDNVTVGVVDFHHQHG